MSLSKLNNTVKKLRFVLCSSILLLMSCDTSQNVDQIANSVADQKLCRSEDDLYMMHARMWIGAQDEQIDFLNCAIKLWDSNKSGMTQNSELDEKVFNLTTSAAEFDPIVFFKYMDRNPKFLMSWIVGLENDVFVWHREPPCKLNGRLSQFVMSILMRDHELSRFSSYKLTKNSISNLKCRQID